MTGIRCETDRRGVARLVLARPEKRNALDSAMIGALAETAGRLAGDSGVRVVVLSAEGPVFSAGGDLDWMRAQMAAESETRRREARALAMALKALNDLPKPLIGRVHGDAYGGGVGLMSVCDVVLAAAGTRFGLTETRLGLSPATIGPYVVERMGAARARQVFFSPRLFGAEEAATLGLVSRVVDPGALDAAIEDEVAAYLTAAPGAVAASKALVARLGSRVDEAAIEASIDALVARWETDEAEEGTRAFFEKRPPGWTRRE
ncbi:crotonase/enoyl-CoA hydratase family protein [Alphaproteobacteria bacterium GH1-50]|uniref:Crotonase/enoyl-CoA hydratase family protein n=1 Tax=Kangsaoukella pontilimi TaxID=2691042 RepID=A0A7C9J2T6_9RHOB|nr:crotonase/enoyl-CoA hydratase family protein [Kangsaoukella pontilimi]MXQ07781.1 crotonase/enoyl-CoA hydratase family protein [Kangsaoukella pontilimi]